MISPSHLIIITLAQGCSILLLEGQCPTEFSSNLLQHTCLEVQDQVVQACLIRIRAKNLEDSRTGAGPSDPSFVLQGVYAGVSIFGLPTRHEQKDLADQWL